MELEDIRREYSKGGLRRKDLKTNPVDQFNLWLQQAIDAKLTCLLYTSDAADEE